VGYWPWVPWELGHGGFSPGFLGFALCVVFPTQMNLFNARGFPPINNLGGGGLWNKGFKRGPGDFP